MTRGYSTFLAWLLTFAVSLSIVLFPLPFGRAAALVSAASREGLTTIQWDEAVRPDKTWTLTFTSPVDIQTIMPGRFVLSDSSGQIIPIHLITALDGMSVRIQPDENLTAGDYTLKTLEGINDLEGREVPDQVEIAFSVSGEPLPDGIEIIPQHISLQPGQTTQFAASLIGSNSAAAISWSAAAPGSELTRQLADYLPSTGTGAEFIGSVSGSGAYQAPMRPGIYYVQARCDEFPELYATAVVTVENPPPAEIDFELDESSFAGMVQSTLPGSTLVLKTRVYNRSGDALHPGGSIVRFLINDRVIDEVPFYIAADQPYEDVRAYYYMPVGEYTDMIRGESVPAVVKAIIDPYDQIPETSETNNMAEHTLSVRYKAFSNPREDGPAFSIDATGLNAWSIKDDAESDRVQAAQPGQRLRLKATINYTPTDPRQDINIQFLVNGVVTLDSTRQIYSRTGGSFTVDCDYQVPFNRSDPVDFRVLLSNGQTAGIRIPVMPLDLAVRPGDLYWSGDVVASPGERIFVHAILKNMASISFANENQRIAWRAMIDGEAFAEGDFVNKFNTLNVALPVIDVPLEQTEPIQLTVITDVYDQISESDETNNFATIEIPIQNTGLASPNFSVGPYDLAAIATPVLPGAHIELQASIHNQGATFPAIGASPEVAFLIDGQEVGRVAVHRDRLQPMQCELVSFNWTAPLDLNGQPVFSIVIDPDGLISETNENDNTAELILDVAQPDLDVTDNPLSWQPGPPVTGQPVTLEAIVKNSGMAPAIQSVLRFFADGQAIGEATVERINGSSATAALVTWQIPAVPEIELPYQNLEGVSGHMEEPGDVTKDFLIQVIADPDESISEVLETNNSSSEITMTATVPTLTKFVYFHLVDVLGDVSSATVEFTAENGSIATVETDDAGWCCFTGVPLGAFTYRIAKDGYFQLTGQGMTQDNVAVLYKNLTLDRKSDFASLGGPDRDGDLIPDDNETRYGTNPDNPDTDGDGVIDGLDLSPTCDPLDPTPEYLQKVGMIRFEQDIGAHGLDGWVDVYDMEYHLLTGDDLEFSYTSENAGTRTSDMSAETIKKAVDRLFADAKFKSYAIDDIPSPDDKHPERIADHVFNDRYIFEADSLHRTEYRFNYDYLVDFQKVSLKNSEEILFPDADSFFNYLLFPVQTAIGKTQSYKFQFTQKNLVDQIYYRSETNYHDLGFQYTFYVSDDFDDDESAPDETMLALVDCDGSERLSFTVHLPASKAQLASYFLKITPVWIHKSGDSIDISPVTNMNWNLTGLSREIQYDVQPDGSSNTLTESVSSLAGFNSPVPTLQSVLDLKSSSASTSWSEDIKSLTYDPAAAAEEQLTLVEFQLEVVRCTNVALNSVSGGMELVRCLSVVTTRFPRRIESFDEIPQSHFYQQTDKLLEGFGVATGVVSIYSNGLQLWRACQKGEKIEIAYYSAKTVGSTASTGLSLYKISTNTVATASKTGRFALTPVKKVGLGITVAVGTVEIAYNITKYNTEDDPIRKASYGEKIGSSSIDLGFGVVSVFFPPLAAFTVTWMVIIEVFGFFTDWGLSYQIAQNPGSAAVFLFEYWVSEQIPSQLAETAYTHIVNTLLEGLRLMNENGVPFVPVFVDPQL